MPRKIEGGPQFDNDEYKKKKGDLTEAQKAQKELNERDRIAKGLENEVFDFGVPEKQEAKDTTVEESKTEAEFSPQPEMPESAETLAFDKPETEKGADTKFIGDAYQALEKKVVDDWWEKHKDDPENVGVQDAPFWHLRDLAVQDKALSNNQEYTQGTQELFALDNAVKNGEISIDQAKERVAEILNGKKEENSEEPPNPEEPLNPEESNNPPASVRQPADSGEAKETPQIDDENLRDLQEGINEILQKSIKGEGTPADNETIRNLFDQTEESLNNRISDLESEIANLEDTGDDEDDEEDEKDNSDKIAEKEEEIEEIKKSLETLAQRKEAFQRSLETGKAPEQMPENEEQKEAQEGDDELVKQAREMDKARREYIDLLKLKTQMIAQNPDVDFSKDLIGKSLEAKADEAEKNGDLKEYQRLVKEMGEHYKNLDSDGMDLPPLPEQEKGGQLELNEGIKRDIREIFQNEFENLELERNKFKESGGKAVQRNGETYDDADFWREKDKLFELDQALTKDKWDEETKVTVLEALNAKYEESARDMIQEGLSDEEITEKGKNFDKLFSLRKELYKNLTNEDLALTPEAPANEKMMAINKESWEIIKQEAKKESPASVRQSADSSEAKQESKENTEQKIETKEEQIAEAKNEIKQAFEQEQPEQETQQKANQNSSKRGEAFKNAYKGEMERRQTEKKELEEQSEEIEKAEKQKERGGVIMAYGGLALYGAMRGVAFMVDRMLNLADIADNPGNWVKKRISEWSDKQQKRFDKHVETYFPEPFARKKLDKE